MREPHLYLLFGSLLTNSVSSFVYLQGPHPSLSSRRPISPATGLIRSRLFAVKKGKALGKKKQKRAKPGSKKASPRHGSEHHPPSQGSATKKKAPASSHSPPWQVLNTKEAKKNIEQEKKRRSDIQDGKIAPSHSMASIGPRAILSKDFLESSERRLLNWKPFNPEKTMASMNFVGAYLLDMKLPRLGVPEVAFLGRSNVGKSSLLNRLTLAGSNKKSDKARVGKTPGATASVNLYSLLDNKDKELMGLVDLPGFGYAKLSKQHQESVQAAAEQYLSRRKELVLGILLVDIRRTPSADDRAVLAALYDMGVPLVVVATKMDKLSSETERERQLEVINEELGLPMGQPLCVSSVTGEGTRELWRILMEACEFGVAELGRKYDDEAAAAVEKASIQEESAPFEDSDEFVYDQGFDWIHGDYENLELVEDLPPLEDGELDYDDEVEGDSFYEEDEPIDLARESIKSLRKKARVMERRGDV